MTGEQITRQIMGNVPEWLAMAFYVAALAACGSATLCFILRLRKHRTALQPHQRLPGQWVSIVNYLALHRELRRDPYAGTAHMLAFYGFFILFLGTCLVFLEHRTPLHFFYGRIYTIASLIIDLGGVTFLIGLMMFAMRWVSTKPDRILRRWWVSSLVVLLLLIGVSGFVLESARIAVDMPEHEQWSVVGYGLASTFRAAGISGEAAQDLHRWTWAIHSVLCVAFFALLPWQLFGHFVYAAASWATRTVRPIAELRTPSQKPGATDWQEFGQRDLLQADACTTCGRCNEVCPAHAAGKALRPREVVLGLCDAMQSGDRPLQAFISDEMIWSCTTCGACNQVCPIGIEVYDKIVEVRRGRVEAGEVPAAAEQVFEAHADRSNPFGKPQSDRMNWAAGMDVPVAQEGEPIELLLWVGCAGSFDPDGRVVTQALVRILNHLGTNYRVLGRKECCTGDPGRRLGEEGLFQQQATAVIALLQSHQVKRILTHCPHCFNSFRNEYPALGGSFEVEHHSRFLSRMIAEGKLSLQTGVGDLVTYHDPCYLGRGNGETLAPRNVLGSLPQVSLVEMQRNGHESFCCGAGGGAMWLDVPSDARVENLRAIEAAATGATTVATACPFCRSMLNAGSQSLNGQSLDIRDLAELVVQAEEL